MDKNHFLVCIKIPPLKRTVLINGLIAGVIVSVITVGINPLVENGTINYDAGVLLGYASMIVAFTTIFFGIRKYRDHVLTGVISFGRAFKVGILITLVASGIYASAWDIYYRSSTTDFTERYTQQYLDKMEAEGATSEEIASMRTEMDAFNEMYKNPVVRFGITLMEILPVGLAISLLSAAILSKTHLQKQGNSRG